MQSKLVILTASLGLAVTGLAGHAAAAPGSCPEARAACQPTGNRPGDQRPRVRVVPKLTPKQVDSQGQLWRAGNHIMS
jgi:hypothetical protein